MNLILLEERELSPGGTVRLSGRRADHVREVLRAAAGDALQVGVLGGRMGTGTVLHVEPGEVALQVALARDPPPRAPLDLLLALPRPKILRRVLQAAAAMGVGRLALLGSYRVEKSYFGSPLLEPAALDEQLRLGLEQGRDTIPPVVTLHRFFKPFIEDELDASFPETQRLLAHPTGGMPLDGVAVTAPRVVVAVGPEGGWTRYEAETLSGRGFAAVSLGPRILRVDTAVPYLAGQVALWSRRG